MLIAITAAPADLPARVAAGDIIGHRQTDRQIWWTQCLLFTMFTWQR